MRQKEAFKIIRALGLTANCRDGEYRVNFKGGKEASAYYTTDREDAVATALQMAGKAESVEQLLNRAAG